MLPIILVMALCTGLAGAVVGYVAWQARLDGRRVLTEDGADAVDELRERTRALRRPGRSPVSDNAGPEDAADDTVEPGAAEPSEPSHPADAAVEPVDADPRTDADRRSAA